MFNSYFSFCPQIRFVLKFNCSFSLSRFCVSPQKKSFLEFFNQPRWFLPLLAVCLNSAVFFPFQSRIIGWSKKGWRLTIVFKILKRFGSNISEHHANANEFYALCFVYLSLAAVDSFIVIPNDHSKTFCRAMQEMQNKWKETFRRKVDWRESPFRFLCSIFADHLNQVGSLLLWKFIKKASLRSIKYSDTSMKALNSVYWNNNRVILNEPLMPSLLA